VLSAALSEVGERMSISWSGKRAASVAKILDDNPPESARCALAAKKVLPHARKEDADATTWEVRPTPSVVFRILSPRVSVGGRWTHHVTVGLQAHFVDALTTATGTTATKYLETHFEYFDQLTMTKRGPNE
jgi:hypothetical protein